MWTNEDFVALVMNAHVFHYVIIPNILPVVYIQWIKLTAYKIMRTTFVTFCQVMYCSPIVYQGQYIS